MRRPQATWPRWVCRFLPSGALGFWDEALFSRQLLAAGYQMVSAPRAVVEHHFHEDRLTHRAFLDRATKEGRSLAYVSWHWGHDPYDSQARFKARKKRLKLALLRMLRNRDARRAEGCAEWEIQIVKSAAYFEHYAIEQQRPRNYSKEGLVKLSPSRLETADAIA